MISYTLYGDTLKILLLGIGVATRGCSRLLTDLGINHTICEIKDLKEYEYDIIVKSPGISFNDEVFNDLKGEVISDIEMVYRLKKPFIIAVTGSNGKTTICSMLYHVLKKENNVVVCGNIGYSFADAVLDNPDCGMFIVECSSYQLEGVRLFSPDIAVISNIVPHHLKHHLTFRDYVESKLNIAKELSASKAFIYNLDISYIDKRHYECSCIRFSTKSTAGEFYLIKNNIMYGGKRIFHLKKRFRCNHTIENIMAVAAVLNELDMMRLIKGINSFKGVKYRLERIGKGIYNDAKSTNSNATNSALLNLKDVHLICGGFENDALISLSEMALNNIKYVYAYGETKDRLMDYFEHHGIFCDTYNTLAEALNSVMKFKEKRDVVLYSPMCPSFDQYESYIKRGEEFESLIKNKK